MSYKAECSNKCFKSILCLSNFIDSFDDCPCKTCIIKCMCHNRCEAFATFVSTNIKGIVFKSNKPFYKIYQENKYKGYVNEEKQ